MKITRVFLDTSMIMGFEGLRAVASKAKSKLGPDTTVLFINKAHTSFKMVVNDQYIVYYKNGHRRIPLDAIRYLPSTFGGSELEVQEAIKKSLISKIGFAEEWK